MLLFQDLKCRAALNRVQPGSLSHVMQLYQDTNCYVICLLCVCVRARAPVTLPIEPPRRRKRCRFHTTAPATDSSAMCIFLKKISSISSKLESGYFSLRRKGVKRKKRKRGRGAVVKNRLVLVGHCITHCRRFK